jgi:adenylylsulfate kinase-like enzyme
MLTIQLSSQALREQSSQVVWLHGSSSAGWPGLKQLI